MSFLPDMFGRKINPGDTFMRIEDKMGGCIIRFYFLGGFTNDDRIHVQEYGGIPRVIKIPSQHKSTLMLLTEDLIQLKGFTPPTIEEVTTPSGNKKVSKANALVI